MDPPPTPPGEAVSLLEAGGRGIFEAGGRGIFKPCFGPKALISGGLVTHPEGSQYDLGHKSDCHVHFPSPEWLRTRMKRGVRPNPRFHSRYVLALTQLIGARLTTSPNPPPPKFHR